MIFGSKHVGAILNVFNVKFYVSALVGVIIKVILRSVGEADDASQSGEWMGYR